MAILKRFTHLNRSGSNHSILDAETAYITGSLTVHGATVLGNAAADLVQITGSIETTAATTAKFFGGLSGSLTQLTDGSSYLRAGSGIQIVTGALGDVTITNTDAGFWDEVVPGTIATPNHVWAQSLSASNGIQVTGSSIFLGNVQLGDASTDIIAVTGSAVFLNSSIFSGSVFLGDSSADSIQVTGSLSVQNAAVFQGGLSGSLTQLADGTSYIIAGAGITVTSASNGAITINATQFVESQPELYYDAVADTAATSGSLAVTGSITLATAGTGYRKLVVGGLDIGPITGAMATVGVAPGIMSGSILSASQGVWDGTNAAMLRHEFHIVGISTDASAYYAGSYLVSTFVSAGGAQSAVGATETSRETAGVASEWDVNINSNVEVTVTGSAGLTVNWYAQRTKEMSISADGSRT